MKRAFEKIFNFFGIFSEKQLSIGDNYQGGKIAYINSTGQHGFIAASSDQDSNIQWTNGSNKLSSSTGAALGLGHVNTFKIVTDIGEGNYAAKQCFDFVLDEYNDWYLPSKDELNKLFLNKDIIGGFSNKYYWSSTGDDNGAWDQDFLTGFQGINNIKNIGKVRSVRAF